MLTESTGFKRRVVTVLAVLLDILRSIPVVSEYVPFLEQLLGLFGGTAVLHATVDKAVTKEAIGTIVAILYLVIAVIGWLPEKYHVLLPTLKQLAGVLAAARLGIGVQKWRSNAKEGNDTVN